MIEAKTTHDPKPKDERKPKGSGYFAAVVGALYLVAFISSFYIALYQFSLPRQWLLRIWLLFVACSLLWWGVDRVKKGRPDSTIGQDTIALVNSIVSSTIALIALLLAK